MPSIASGCFQWIDMSTYLRISQEDLTNATPWQWAPIDLPERMLMTSVGSWHCNWQTPGLQLQMIIMHYIVAQVACPNIEIHHTIPLEAKQTDICIYTWCSTCTCHHVSLILITLAGPVSCHLPQFHPPVACPGIHWMRSEQCWKAEWPMDDAGMVVWKRLAPQEWRF